LAGQYEVGAKIPDVLALRTVTRLPMTAVIEQTLAEVVAHFA
jgi:hypothetical protein